MVLVPLFDASSPARSPARGHVKTPSGYEGSPQQPRRANSKRTEAACWRSRDPSLAATASPSDWLGATVDDSKWNLVPPACDRRRKCQSAPTSPLMSPAASPAPPRKSHSRRSFSSGLDPRSLVPSRACFGGSCSLKRNRFKKPNTVPRDPSGGKLALQCVVYFCQAYGLGGLDRKRHDLIVNEAVENTGCSERAIHEVLYGHSYGGTLQKYRDMIPGYPPKISHRKRATQLEAILADRAAHEFYRFDANKVQTTTRPAGPVPTKTLRCFRSLSFDGVF